MVPPAGGRPKRLPTLTWESVVDDAPNARPDPTHDDAPSPAPDASAAASLASVVPPPPPTAPLVLPSIPMFESVAPDPGGSNSGMAGVFAPMSLHDHVSVSPTDLAIEPLAIEPVTIEPVLFDLVSTEPEPIELETSAGPSPSSTSLAPTDVPAVHEHVHVRTNPPSAVVAAIADVRLDPVDISALAQAAADALPEIREATPVEVPITSADVGVMDADPSTAVPLLPTVRQTAPRPASAPVYTEPVTPPLTTTARKKKRRSRRVMKLLVTLVVLGALVAAVIVFGRAYLFPDEWDGGGAPYADAVELGLGIEFVEPLAVVAEPTADFNLRFARQLQGEWTDVQPQWRALGITAGLVTDERIAQQVAGLRAAVYSTDDGQVYHDIGVSGAELDAQLTLALALASLDQNFGWSVDQPSRTLDAAALTSAEVLRQAHDGQQASVYAAPIAPLTVADVADLPSVLAYRMLAPEMYVPFRGAPDSDGDTSPRATSPTDTSPADTDTAASDTSPGETVPGAASSDTVADLSASDENPLQRLDAGGPGPLGTAAPIEAPEPTMIGTDAIATTPTSMDRSFWFLVFAGFLDSRTAYVASEAIVENSLGVAERGVDLCAYATFAGGGIGQTETLRSALQEWSDAVPADFASSFSVLDDGTLQLVSCDPGAAFTAPLRPNAVGELVAWRVAELATMEAVGTSDPDDSDFLEAWPFVEGSDIALELAALPTDTTPADVADAARAAVGALFVPGG